MTIGVLQLSLFIPGACSLKAKRQILKSLKDRVRKKFNVSVAETEGLEKWQRQTLAVACVNNNKRFLNSVLSKVVNLVESDHAVELIDYTIEIL